eukprot:scaffold234165_cov19-Prasinocladus_malaysianus.AAC.1
MASEFHLILMALVRMTSWGNFLPDVIDRSDYSSLDLFYSMRSTALTLPLLIKRRRLCLMLILFFGSFERQQGDIEIKSVTGST